MNSKELSGSEFSFCGQGSNLLEKAIFKNNSIYINKQQYFSNVDETLWNEYIGAYQPLQKWAKDRKGITLSADEIEHYQKMISALKLTQAIMSEIDCTFAF